MCVLFRSVNRSLKIMFPDPFRALKIDTLVNIEDDGPLR